MKVLIAGWAGTGKSTLAKELQLAGVTALDSDTVPGLSAWRDRESGAVVEVDYSQSVNLDRLAWIWDKTVLSQLLSEHSDLFLCGNATNIWDFIADFDLFIALDIDEAIQRQRIRTRQDNPYGKHPTDLDRIITAQKQFIEKAASAGAVIVDANQPVKVVVQQILDAANPEHELLSSE